MRYKCARGTVPPPWVSVSAVTYCNISPEIYLSDFRGSCHLFTRLFFLSTSPERDFCKLRLESIIVSAVMAWSCVQNWCISAVMSPFCRPAAGHLPPLPSYAFSSICYPCPCLHYHPSPFILPAIVTSSFCLSPQTIVQSDLPSQ